MSAEPETLGMAPSEVLAKRREFLRKSMAAPAIMAAAAMIPKAAEAAIGTAGYYFNVKDYGAIGNATLTGTGTDDTLAIQAAITAATAVGGGIVIVPAGRYLVTGTLTITSAVWIEGAHASSSGFIIPSTSNIDVIVFNNATGGIRNLSVYSSSGRTAGRAIYINTGYNVIIEGFQLTNQFIGCEISGGNTNIVRSGRLDIAAGGIGILVDGPSAQTDARISGIVSSGGYSSVQIKNASGIWFADCDFTGATVGFAIIPASGQFVEWVFVSACAIDSCQNDCIHIESTGTGYVRGVNFVNSWSVTSTNGTTCVILGAVDGCRFVGHTFGNAVVGNGLWVSGPVKNVTVDSSTVWACPNGSGFAFASGPTDFAIRDCLIGLYAASPALPSTANKFGIAINSSASTRYIITNNMIRGNTTGISDLGVAPKVVSGNIVS